MKFLDRKEAGRLLAQKLNDYKNCSNCLFLALPRGGVPVALEIALELNVKMDIFLVHKIGFPKNEEYAMGAIAEGGMIIWNEDVVQNYKIADDVKELEIAKQQAELERRNNLYRQNRKEIQVYGKKIILVDDGLATGCTMIAAIKMLRKKGASEIIVALPVGPKDMDKKLNQADKIICLHRAEDFSSVGQFYKNFKQLEDEEVLQYLSMIYTKK